MKNFIDRAYPQSLADCVFQDQFVQAAVMQCSQAQFARELLFYGPPGSGKSALCKMLAYHLTAGNKSCVKVVNVSMVSTKAALASAVKSSNLLPTWNPLGRGVIILEELDGADDGAQRSLKVILEEEQANTLFLATTNDLGRIQKAIRDRFDVHLLERPAVKQWVPRAQALLAKEGHRQTLSEVANLLHSQLPPNSSARDVMRFLENYVAKLAKQQPKPTSLSVKTIAAPTSAV